MTMAVQGNGDSPQNLGDALAALLAKLTDLLAATADPADQARLAEAIGTTNAALGKVIGEALDQADQRYQDAIAGVIQATQAVEQAQKQVQSIAALVQTVASVVAKVAALAGAV